MKRLKDKNGQAVYPTTHWDNVRNSLGESISTAIANIRTTLQGKADATALSSKANSSSLGNLTELATTDKTSAVAAINEVAGKEPLIVTNSGQTTSHTYAQILEAHNAHRPVVVYRADYAFVLVAAQSNTLFFTALQTSTARALTLTSGGIWTLTNYGIQLTQDRIGNVANWQSGTSYYPSTAAADARFVPKSLPLITSLPTLTAKTTINLNGSYKHLEIAMVGVEVTATAYAYFKMYNGGASDTYRLTDTNGNYINAFARFTTGIKDCYLVIDIQGNYIQMTAMASPGNAGGGSTLVTSTKKMTSAQSITHLYFDGIVLTAGEAVIYGY